MFLIEESIFSYSSSLQPASAIRDFYFSTTPSQHFICAALCGGGVYLFVLVPSEVHVLLDFHKLFTGWNIKKDRKEDSDSCLSFHWEMQIVLFYVSSAFLISSPSLLPQEIPLSEILQVEQCRDYSNLAQGSNPHCFEIITATMVYYVGENNGSHYHSPALAASGVGMEVAQGWEKAIRQALMPVTPQPSVASAAGQGKDHSK